MSTIPGTSQENPWAALGLASQAPTRDTSLGQADFLRLMTEQLKHQDPLKPMENTEFLGQLAQFSTVQGIQDMQGAMGSMASVMESDQTLRAAALVGHDALVQADAVELQAGADGGLSGEVEAVSGGPVRIDIVDASGAIVHTTTLEADGAGPVGWEWDGLDGDGVPVDAGRYGIVATSGTGEDATALEVRLQARVDSVSIGAAGLVLNLAGLGSHSLSSVRRLG